MEFHEIANIFPLVEGVEFDALVLDIKENGLLEPIRLYENKILDGRNRYRACQNAGIKPKVIEYIGDNPFMFVVKKNLHQRHLNVSQRAVIAAQIANIPQGIRIDLQHSSDRPAAGLVSQVEAAKMFNVSERAIRRVKVVEREAPELITEIKSGKITVYKALKKIKAGKRQEKRKELTQKGKVYDGKGDLGFYKIWPSAKYPGFFHVDQIILPKMKNEAVSAISTVKPMSKKGVLFWLENIVKDTIKWTVSGWDGREFNFFMPRKKEKKLTTIYFIEAVGTGFVKIGRGEDRLEYLQTGCPFLLRYLCRFKDISEKESELHKRFEKDHYRGEWFYLSKDIQNFIEEVKRDD